MLDSVKSAPAKARDNVTGWWQNSRSFFAEVRNEMKRVTWPTKKEVYATTFVVILTSIFFGVYLWGIDLLLSRLVHYVFTSFGAA
jgi:preprotein translocase subunit SecE